MAEGTRGKAGSDTVLSSKAVEDVEPKIAKNEDESVFIARMAIALSHLPPGTDSLFTVPEARKIASEVSEKYRKALADDWRVAEVLDEIPLTREFDNARTETFFDVFPEADNLTDVIVPFEAMLFNEPILFRISVLAKNQPLYRSMNDVPADDYLVIWDGAQLVIQWEQDNQRASGSGGHVVFDVLADVGKTIGYPVTILACSRGCHHKFVHGDFVTFVEDEVAEEFHAHGDTPVGSTIHTPYSKDVGDIENIHRTFSQTGVLLDTFARAKSYSDAILYLDWRARRDSQDLLSVAYQQASRRRSPHLIGAAKDLWALRGARRAKRTLMAGLWLALASIDTYRVTWRQHDARFIELLGDPRITQLGALFDSGHDYVDSQDMTIVSSSLQEVATRAEGGRLFLATLAAAAAAFLAAFLTALLTSHR